jgi:GTPase KRas protein
MEERKIVLLGSGGIGKSSITLQFVKGQFISNYNPTIEEAYTKQLSVDDKVLKLHVLDTAGQEEYTAMRDQYMRDGEGFILVYAVNDPSSLYEVDEIYKQLLRSKDMDNEEGFPIVVVCNKCDLPANEHLVSKDEAAKLVRQFGNKCRWFEASAKTGKNISECFDTIVRLMRNEEMTRLNENEQKESINIRSERGFISFMSSLSSSCETKKDLEDIKAVF